MSSTNLLPLHVAKSQKPLSLSNNAQDTNRSIHGGRTAVGGTPKPVEDKRKELNYKTVMCISWLKTNKCSYADRCRFAHGEHDRRPPQQPMPVRRKTQLCKKYTIAGICPFGNLCKYIHPSTASAPVNYQQSTLPPLYPMYPSVAYGVPDMYGAFAEPQYYTPTPPPNSNFGMLVMKKCECDVSNSLLHVRAPKPNRAPLLPLRHHPGGCSTTVASYMEEQRPRITPSAPPLQSSLESVIWSPEKRNGSAGSAASGEKHAETPLRSFDDSLYCNVDSQCDVESLAERVAELDVISKPLFDELGPVELTSQQTKWSGAATPVARPKEDRVSRGPFSIDASAFWKD